LPPKATAPAGTLTAARDQPHAALTGLSSAKLDAWVKELNARTVGIRLAVS
jgi:hypothetical protein